MQKLSDRAIKLMLGPASHKTLRTWATEVHFQMFVTLRHISGALEGMTEQL